MSLEVTVATYVHVGWGGIFLFESLSHLARPFLWFHMSKKLANV